MARGGARNRSGPQADEESERSEQRGYRLTALPSEGYKGKVPKYPLPSPVVPLNLPKGQVSAELIELLRDERKQQQAAFVKREGEVWRELWRTPQACAWSIPSEFWRLRIIAQYCRLTVRCEDADAPASLLAQLHRFADQIGLTTAGLAEMGWKVAEDEIDQKRQEKTTAAPEARPARRLRAVDGG